MGIEGQGVRQVIMRRQRPFVIQRFDRDGSIVNADGIIIPEKDELQYALLFHLPLSDKLLNEPGAQRSRNDKSGWALSEEVINNENKITIKDRIFTVNDLQEFDSHSEFLLVRSGERNNRVE